MEKIRRLSTGRAVTVRRNDGLRKRCDCARRTWPKCPHPWHFNFKWNGVHFRFPLKTYAGDRPVTAKNDARAEADRLRAMIRDGRFPPAPSTPALVSTAAATAFDAFTQLWRERARDGMKKQQQASDASRCKRLGNLLLAPDQRLGDRPIGAITEDDLETAFKALGAVAASSFNKFRQTIVHLQRWGERKGYLARPWIVFTKESPITRRKGARRDRRLIADVLDRRRRMKTPGEERRLLEHASPWLQRLIIAAVDSCCRRGELLSLQWRDVDLSRHILRVRAEHAKTAEARDVPISARLRGVLQMIRHDPDGHEHPPHAFVFGDRIGGQVKDPKKAWAKCCTDAGISDLHFHDLRHEGASRWLEAGWPLQHVQKLLGHADAATTSIYLNVDTSQLLDSMRRFPGPARPLHTVAHGVHKSVGRARNASKQTAANVLVN